MEHNALTVVLGALLVISESLGGIKRIAENSIYQILIKILKFFYQAIAGKSPTAKA